MIQDIKQKVSYLQGLCDGLDITESEKQGKVIMKIIDILENITGELSMLSEVQEDIVEQVNEIDDALNEVEEYLFEEDDDADDDDDDEDLDFLDDFECEDIQCPNCGKTLLWDGDLLDDDDGSVVCPSCGERIEVDFDCDCEHCSGHNDNTDEDEDEDEDEDD